MSTNNKEAAILAVISLLILGLLYNSFFRANMVFAYYCENFGDRTVKCCQTNPDGKSAWCTTCDKTNPPSNCSPRFLEGTPNTSTPPPPPNNVLPVSPPAFSNALPPPSTSSTPTGNNSSIPPALSITKEHNLASTKVYGPPSQQQQTTCPDGSAPDANGNCPPVTQGSSPSTDNTPSEHHQKSKGNDLLGGQELSTRRAANNDNSPTPPACPDKGPIPPNCTLKPKF
jgi:hypothetical protein